MARLFTAASSEYLEIDSAAVSGLPLTFFTWFYISVSAVARTFIFIGDKDSANEHYEVGLNSADNVLLRAAGGGSGQNVATATAATLDTWHTAAGTLASGVDMNVFIDGGDKTFSDFGPAASGLDRTSIGRRGASTPSQYADARLASTAIWNVVLTDAEIASLARGVPPTLVRPSGIVGYWPIIGKYSPEIDLVGGFNLTVNGTTAADHPRVYYPPRRRLFYGGAAGGTTYNVNADTTGKFFAVKALQTGKILIPTFRESATIQRATSLFRAAQFKESAATVRQGGLSHSATYTWSAAASVLKVIIVALTATYRFSATAVRSAALSFSAVYKWTATALTVKAIVMALAATYRWSVAAVRSASLSFTALYRWSVVIEAIKAFIITLTATYRLSASTVTSSSLLFAATYRWSSTAVRGAALTFASVYKWAATAVATFIAGGGAVVIALALDATWRMSATATQFFTYLRTAFVGGAGLGLLFAPRRKIRRKKGR